MSVVGGAQERGMRGKACAEGTIDHTGKHRKQDVHETREPQRKTEALGEIRAFY